jgi:hypothetical protein
LQERRQILRLVSGVGQDPRLIASLPPKSGPPDTGSAKFSDDDVRRAARNAR